jgi:ABC-type phosphate transport system substrate-binding protein
VKAARRLALALTVLLGLFTSPLRGEVVAVVGARSPIGSLTEAQIADVFLGRLTRLPGGQLALPLDQAEGSPARDEFYQRVAGKSPAQLKAFWSKLIFTGRGRPPKSVASAADVVKFVRENPAAIGYIDRKYADASVRILR